MAKKKLPTAQAAEIKEHRAAWTEIQSVIPDYEFRKGESLCATVVRLIKERNAVFTAIDQIKTQYLR